MTDDELNGYSEMRKATVRADLVKPLSLSFAGNDLFLRNNLNLLYGRQGLGKSTLAAWLAAEIGGTVLWLSVEESPETTAQRLEAAGHSRKDAYLLSPDDKYWPSFELENDPSSFRLFVEAHDPSLVVLDPATRFLGRDVDDNQERDVRGGLEELQRIAVSRGITVVIIRHENKYGSGLAQVMGATAWSAVPRCGVRVYEEKGVLYAERVKCNQAPPLARVPAHLVSAGEVARFEPLSGEAALAAMRGTTAEAVGAAALELLGGRDFVSTAEARDRIPVQLGVMWPAVLAHLGQSTVAKLDGKTVRGYRRQQLERIASGQDLSGLRVTEDCGICGVAHAPWVDCGD